MFTYFCECDHTHAMSHMRRSEELCAVDSFLLPLQGLQNSNSGLGGNSFYPLNHLTSHSSYSYFCSLSLFLPLSDSLCLSSSPCLCVSLSLCISVSYLCGFLCLCLHLSVSLSLSLPVSVSLYVSLYACEGQTCDRVYLRRSGDGLL